MTTPTIKPTVEEVDPARASSDAGRRRRRAEPLVVIGLAIFVAWTLVAITWRLWAPDPYATAPLAAYAPPSADHWFGTDELGRDVFGRVMAGSSTVLTVAPAATVLTILIGVTVGALAGYRGGLLDEVVVRVIDFILAFPSLIVAIIVLSMFGSGPTTLVLIMAVFFSPLTARVVRGSVHNLRNADFVEAARMRGDGTFRIIGTELLPNMVQTIGVEVMTRLASIMIAMASLSFLGRGIKPPKPDWGLMISADSTSVAYAWWASMFPAIALGSLVMAVAILAEGLRKVGDR